MGIKNIGRKGQIGKKLTPLIIIIVTVVVLFQIFSSIVPEAQSAGDQMSDDTICSNAGCFVNSTLTPTCRNNVSPAGFGGNSSVGCLASLQNIPLASIFGSSGIIILLLMAVLFISVLKMVLPGSSKK